MLNPTAVVVTGSIPGSGATPLRVEVLSIDVTDVKPGELTARLLVQPSAMVPGVPPFVFSLPAGWVVDEAPGAVAVLRLAEQVDGFWINAIVSHERVARSVDFKTAAQVTWAKVQRDSPGVRSTFERLARFGANPVYLRGSELTAPETNRRLAQLHAMFFAPTNEGGKVVDFFQIVCTTPAELSEQFGPQFVEIIGSFRFV
jgi:hypothetical protein